MVRRNDNEPHTANAAAMIRAIDNTGIRMFMYYPQTHHITIPENTCQAYNCKPVYENMPHSFADDYVDEADYPVFKEMYYAIDRGEKTATAVFHSKDHTFCNHVTLTTVSWTEDGSPDEVFGLIENISGQYHSEQFVKRLQEELALAGGTDNEMDEALKTIASSIGSQYYAVYYIWADTHTYVCFQEKLEGILSLIGTKGEYETSWDLYINGYIEEKDRAGVREFIELDSVCRKLKTKNSITYNYRRKEVGWTRGQFIAGKRDESGNVLTIIYTVSDINEEMENKQKKHEAEQAALHDPMTGMWNRKAFDQFKDSDQFKLRQSGLILFDIDRFKVINDQFGHEQGDHVIKTVSEQIHNELRQDDLVFRMGGDEFAVLLYDCNENIWNSVCRKIARIHSDIKEILPKEMLVTISAGLCVSQTGYTDEMYSLADKALYNTKVTGRGGCTLIDGNGTIVREWHDNSHTLRVGDVLERNSTVTWRVDYPKKAGLPVKAYGDDEFLSFIGTDSSASPEEIYKIWLARIVPDYFDIIKEAAKTTITEGRSEVVYLWKHPEKGVIQARSSSSLDSATEDYCSIIGITHITTGTHIFTLEDVSTKVKNALEEMYFYNFYIRLNDYSFVVYKAQDYMVDILGGSANAIDAVDNYIRYMVAPESKKTMSEYLDLTTLKTRMKDTNVIGANYNDPHIGWSRARFVAVDRGEDGELETVSLVVEAIK